MNRLKWLYPGMRIKRWVFLSFLGAVIFGAGLILFTNAQATSFLESFYLARFNTSGQNSPQSLGMAFIIIGFIMVVIGFRSTMNSVFKVLAPEQQNNVAEFIYRKHHLERGPKIVVIGGGTGLSVLLRGLKKYTSNITAIVTVADDGGSSGQIRGEFGILPPGDIRNCLVALADKETLMEDLFQHRFSNGDGLTGHSMGNLLIAAMTQISGDFHTAVKEISKVLAVRGQVLPATLRQCTLCAEFEDGTVIEGESKIPRIGKAINRVFLNPAHCDPLPEALTAISGADIIVLGPGSLYTSIIPNLLVRGMAEDIANSKAVTVYVSNIMTQPGETEGYSAADHIRAIRHHAGSWLIDYAIVNVQEIPQNLRIKYELEGAEPVKPDLSKIKMMGIEPVEKNLVSKSDVVRHDPEKLAEAIVELVEKLKMKREKFYFSQIFSNWRKFQIM